jgi:hypothetical protein
MGLVSRLQNVIVAAGNGGDLEAVRELLIDEADVAAAAPPNVRRWYGRLWDRLSEWDYGHIDDARLRLDLRNLGSEAPAENVVETAFGGFTSPAATARVSVLTFSAGLVEWPPEPSLTEAAGITAHPAPPSWAGAGLS